MSIYPYMITLQNIRSLQQQKLKQNKIRMTEQIKNSLNLQESQNSKQQAPESETSKLQKILLKPYESRYGSDNLYIVNFIKENIALSKLGEEISMEFVKNLFKSAIVVTPKKDTIICMNGEKIQELGIVLSGQLAVIRTQQQIHQAPSISNDQIFDKLLQNAKIFTKQLRKKQSSIALDYSSKKSLPLTQKSYQPLSTFFPDFTPSHHIETYINPNQFFGWKDRSIDQNFIKTCVCLNDETSLLLFKESNVMIYLQAALKQKIKKIASLLKGIPCFSMLDIDRLNLVIQNMVLRKKKKMDYIYRQGQPNNSIYLLTEGQLKITKQSNLFQQNPNNLHGNRKKLVEETLISSREADKVQKVFIDKKVKKSMLPYANLTTMYNFRPMKKMIEIGVVTPFSLFGDEEFGVKKQRDTNAICSSLQAQYYEINVPKLQQIVGNKLLPLFQKQLKDYVRKKILYRQTQYATTVNLQNSNNLDYFYIEDGKQKQSPRKFRITKFNNMIESKKQSPNSPGKNQQNETNATYTAFNFNKMKKLSQTDRKNIKHDYDDEEEQKYQNSHIELKIMDMTHTWKLMKEKVDMEVRASQKISPFKPTINLRKPLIASDYFIHVQKQSKRIDREHRKRIASLSRSYKMSRATDKSNIQF